MRKLLLPLLVLIWGSLTAQEKQRIPIYAGLYAPYATQPGLKLGASFSLRSMTMMTGNGEQNRHLYLSPQFAVFHRFNNHTSYQLSTDLGIYNSRRRQKLYIAYSLGIGYLMENQTLGTTIDLGTGNVASKDKDLRTYFLPTLNIELGKLNSKKIAWYSRIAYGRKVSRREDSGFFALEFGIRMHLRKATSS